MKLSSLNVRGLREKNKRRAVFNFLRCTNSDLILLQETHLANAEEQKLWEMEWGSKMYSSFGTSNARGATILVHPKFEGEITEHCTDNEGRLICLQARVSDKLFTVCNIYAPNMDDMSFFTSMIDTVEKYVDRDGIILGGDFNLVMNPELDRNDSNINNTKSLEVVREFMDRNNLCDVWRVMHPEERLYTWHRWGKKHKPMCSRIDLFLIPLGYMDCVEESNISTGFMTDHSIINVKIKIDIYKRGPGNWKFNNTLLSEKELGVRVEECVKYIVECSEHLNPNDRWEFIKSEVGSVCRKYSQKKTFDCRAEYTALINEKSELLKQLGKPKCNNLNNVQERLDELTKFIEFHEINKAQGSIFRSKCQYAKDGEKCTKYFFSLEKKRYLEKNMKAVYLDDGSVSTQQSKILEEQRKFFQVLYDSDDNVNFALTPNKEERTLLPDEKSFTEAEFTSHEFFDAMMTLKSGKVPGLDGITIEFYRHFWKLLSPYLIEMFQYSFETGLLPESVRKGYISLLPKKDKNPKFVKNKRPLTILGNDYKILAKALDNRLREILPKLIHHDQCGFVKGRKISHNVRKSLDIMEYARLNKIPAVILSIDMEKCFDRLEHRAIFGSLKYFNFSTTYIRWVSLFYNQFQICTQNFGYFTEFWTKKRGTNQGCPLSPGLYLLTAEIMANKLRLSSGVKGIRMNEIEYLLSQFADDTDMYLEFSENNIKNVFNILSNIEGNTGLRISYEKTTIYRIGSISNTNAKVYTTRKVVWSNDAINTLGVDISNNVSKESNFRKIIAKLKAISKMWYHRTMTLMGKVLLVNTLMASLFVYKMQVLPLISEQCIIEIESAIENFLWNGKRPKIPLKTLKCNISDGGLGLVDIKTKHIALMFNWIADCNRSPAIYNLARTFLGEYCENNLIWQFNLSTNDSKKMFPGTSYWHDLLHEWHGYNFNEPQNREKVLDQVMFYNSHILCNKTPITSKKCISQGVTKIESLWNSNRIYKFDKFEIIYGNVLNWLEFSSLVSAIPDQWLFFLKTPNLIDEEITRYDWLKDKKKMSGVVYHDILATDKVVRRCFDTWCNKIEMKSNLQEFKKNFINLKCLTKVTKLRNFQYRLLHNKIFCNDVLVHWKKVESNLCNICLNEKQSIVHLLYECIFTRNLIDKIQVEFEKLEIPAKWEIDNIICNTAHEKPVHIANLVVLILKFYVFRCKCSDTIPEYHALWGEIVLQYRIAIRNSENVKSTIERWSPVIPIIQSFMSKKNYS